MEKKFITYNRRNHVITYTILQILYTYEELRAWGKGWIMRSKTGLVHFNIPLIILYCIIFSNE